MVRLLRFLFLISFPLCAYTPSETLNGPVQSIRTYKILLREIPAGTREEPWFSNIDYDESSRKISQWYYDMGQEYRRHEFRYEEDGEGRELTRWLTYYTTPDGRPPLRRLAGYEQWFSLKKNDDPSLVETRFETVQSHPVKSVYRYYDEEDRLVFESDTLQDLDVKFSYDDGGKLTAKQGLRGEALFWEERYLYDEEGRLKSLIQSDLNGQLYERGEYSYEENRRVFSKYVLDRPITDRLVSDEPLGTAVFKSIKDYQAGQLIRLRNYNWNGPMGLRLTQEQLYSYDNDNRLVRVEEPNSRETWELVWDDRGNWIRLTYSDELNHPGESPVTWRRDIRYYEDSPVSLKIDP
jgi:YD repeat-containing protein